MLIRIKDLTPEQHQVFCNKKSLKECADGSCPLSINDGIECLYDHLDTEIEVQQ